VLTREHGGWEQAVGLITADVAGTVILGGEAAENMPFCGTVTENNFSIISKVMF